MNFNSKRISTIITALAVMSLLMMININTTPTSEKYQIKKWHSTYINKTGVDTEEYKIRLSDNYWTSGRFEF